MKVHGEAVYNTIPLAPYEEDNIVYLQSKDKKTMYVYLLSNKSDVVVIPSRVVLNSVTLNKTAKIILLDAPKEKMKWKVTSDGVEIDVPPSLQNKKAGKYAVAFRITL